MAEPLPDAVGIRLEMSTSEAIQIAEHAAPGMEQLSKPRPGEKSNPTTVTLGNVNYLRGLRVRTEERPPEQNITIRSTQAPSKPAVYMVENLMQASSFSGTMATKTTLAALREKYGKEALVERDGNTLWWIFDKQGRHAPIPDVHFVPDQRMPAQKAEPSAVLQTCWSLVSGNSLITSGKDPICENEFTQKSCDWCLMNAILVRAQIVPAQNPELLQQAQVSVMHVPLAAAAGKETGIMVEKDAEQKKREEVGKASKNKAKF